jgi:HSP20 family molecular chaperone IbpA
MGNVKITRFESDTELIPVLAEFQRLNDEITRRAYQLFEARGQAHGQDVDDWLLAESQILGAPAAELWESDENFEVAISLAGFKAPHISVAAGKRETVVSAQSGVADAPSIKVMRHIRYPAPVDVATVRASFANGILKVVSAKAGAQ